MSVLERMVNDIERWINHSKEGNIRTEEDLLYFDILWKGISDIIIQVEKMSDPSEEERDIVKLMKFDGTLYRVHKEFSQLDPSYGVKESNHYLSWTKNEDLADIYWLHKGSEYLIITAKAENDCFAIDLMGFQQYIQKYVQADYTFGSPAITREQEVVFPVQFKNITRMEIKVL